MTEEHYSFHESEATVRLQSVVDAFINRATAAYSHLPGMHVDRINSPANNRNLVLSRCAHYCLDHKDVLPALVKDIKDFLIGLGTPVIVGAANEYNGKVYDLVGPSRHHHVIQLIRHSTKDRSELATMTEGFVIYDVRNSPDKQFIARKTAYDLAVKNGQLQRIKGNKYYQGSELFSEDLWL